MTAQSNPTDERSTRVESSALITRWVRTSLSALSFWSAISLPVLYIPLFVSGLESTTGLGLFLGLFGLHVLALIGGRKYNRETSRS